MSYTPIASAVRNVLALNAGIIAAGVSAKIYPRVLPQNAKVPAITYQVLADIPYDTIDGMAGLYRAILEYKVWTEAATLAAEIENTIRLAIQGYQGVNLGVNIRGIHHLHGTDDFEAETGEYNQISRYSVFYERENPSR